MDVADLFDADGRYLYIDGCPKCVKTYNHPQTTTWEGGGIRTTYCCPACAHRWFTGWQPQNGESAATFREAS